MPSRPFVFFGAFLALAAGAVFSFGSVTVRLSPHLDAIQYLLWRNFGLLPLMVALALLQGLSPWRQIAASGWLGAAGGLCMTVTAFLFIYAMKRTTIANALLFSSAAPLVGALLARVVLRERIVLGTWLGIAVGAAGLLIMTWGDLGSGDAVGNLAAFGTAFGYGLYSIIARLGRDRDMSGVAALWALLTLASCSLILWLTGGTVATPAPENAAAMVHGAFFIGGGMILLNRAARYVGAGRLVLLAQTETILGPVWVFLLFQEAPRLTTILGGAVVLTGVIVAAVAQPLPDAAEADPARA